jgi:hypothetical protein
VPITPDYDRQLTGQLHLSGEDAAVFMTAYTIENNETQRDYIERATIAAALWAIRSPCRCFRTGVAGQGAP